MQSSHMDITLILAVSTENSNMLVVGVLNFGIWIYQIIDDYVVSPICKRFQSQNRQNLMIIFHIRKIFSQPSIITEFPRYRSIFKKFGSHREVMIWIC